MFSARITQTIVRGLDRLTPKAARAEIPPHLLIGKRGEEDAYFYLRKQGYVIVARNFRTARHHGEIDLIGWDRDVLCFIEVKTRTTREVKPAEAAVDRKKRRDLRVMIRYYLRTLTRRQFPTVPQWRFDILTVHYESTSVSNTGNSLLLPKSGRNGAPRGERPSFELFRNAALSS